MNTVVIGYSDSAGKPKVSLQISNFQYKRILLGPEDYHCKQSGTLTSVTLTDIYSIRTKETNCEASTILFCSVAVNWF